MHSSYVPLLLLLAILVVLDGATFDAQKWFIGGFSQTCTEACSSMGLVPDTAQQATLTTQANMDAVAARNGQNCLKYFRQANALIETYGGRGCWYIGDTLDPAWATARSDAWNNRPCACSSSSSSSPSSPSSAPVPFPALSMTTGATWIPRTAAGIQYWRAVASSSDGTKLAATAGQDNSADGIFTSSDSGQTWTLRSGAGSRDWNGIASSADGTKLAATAQRDYIYTSSDSGQSWTKSTIGGGDYIWSAIASSADGTKLAATEYGYIWTSVNSGVSWTQRKYIRDIHSTGVWWSIASSTDGVKLAAVAGPTLSTSSNSGVVWSTWSNPAYSGSRDCMGVASSSDGLKLVAACDYLYTSKDAGATWTQQTAAGSRQWSSVASSADGSLLIAAVGGHYYGYPAKNGDFGSIYASRDYGSTWTEQTSAGSQLWAALASSADGSKLVAVANNGYVYTASGSAVSAGSTIETSDGDILCDFYNTMPVAGKAKLTNWCGAKSNGNYVSGPCTGTAGAWLGVTCAVVGGASRVTKIDTYNAGVTAFGGSLPTSIGGLSALTTLDLGFTGISGTIPSSVGSLTGLTKLGLTQAGISGSIPSSLGGLTGLTHINLGTNSLTGSIPSSLGALTGLTGLSFAVNSLAGTIPSSLGNLGALIGFDLGYNSLTGNIPSSLGALTKSVYLGLNNNALTGSMPASFCSFQSSVNLQVQSNPGLTCYPSCLSSYPSFQKDASLSAACAVPTPYPVAVPTPYPVFSAAAPPLTWTERTSAGTQYWKGMASSSDGVKLVAITGSWYDLNIYTSSDSGLTWRQCGPSSSSEWTNVASSSDGVRLAATMNSGGSVWLSSNSGATWAIAGAGGSNYLSVSSSFDGTTLVVGTQGGYVSTSSDSGRTWTPRWQAGSQWSVASSADGSRMAAGAPDGGGLRVSIDSGVSWSTVSSSSIQWALAMSADGSVLAAGDSGAVNNGGYMYTSRYPFTTMTQRASAQFCVWNALAISSDGTKIAAACGGVYWNGPSSLIGSPGYIYTSIDGGTSWTQQTSAGSRTWKSIAMSSDGAKIIAAVSNGYIYTVGVSTPAGCSPGSASASGYVPCSSCVSGTYASSSSATTCTQVTAGAYATANGAASSSGATGQAACPAGTFSAAAGSSACTLCPTGWYQTSSASTACTKASAGSFAVGPSGAGVSNSATGVAMCPLGSFSDAGATSCYACPGGYFSSAQGQPCGQCQANTFPSIDGATAVTSAATQCVACAIGTNSNAGDTACTTCPTGTYFYKSPSGQTSCLTNAPPTLAPTLTPTQAPTVGLESLAATLTFSGLTQSVVSADTSGSISKALQSSVATALGLSAQVASGRAAVNPPVWTFTTSSERYDGRRLAAGATATVVVQAFTSDLTSSIGSPSASQVQSSLSAASMALGAAVQQSLAVQSASPVPTIGFLGASAAILLPTQAPTPVPTSTVIADSSASSAGNTTSTIVGAVVGILSCLVMGACLVLATRRQRDTSQGEGQGQGKPAHAYEEAETDHRHVWSDVEADGSAADASCIELQEQEQEHKAARKKKDAVLLGGGLFGAALFSKAAAPSRAMAAPKASSPPSLPADPWAEGLAVAKSISGETAQAAAEALLPGILSLAHELPVIGAFAGILLQFHRVYKTVGANVVAFSDLKEQVDLGADWIREIAPQLKSKAIESALVEQALRRVVAAVHHATQLVASISSRYEEAGKKGLLSRVFGAFTSVVLSSDESERLTRALTWLKEDIAYLLQTIPIVTGLEVKAKLDTVADNVSAIMTLLDDKAQAKERSKELQKLQLQASEISLNNVIGEGGFAVVYDGTYHGNLVAIKVVKRKDGDPLSAKEKQAIENELLMTRFLADPNILHCYGLCHEAGRSLMVLEFAPYGSLWEILDDEATFPRETQGGGWFFFGAVGGRSGSGSSGGGGGGSGGSSGGGSGGSSISSSGGAGSFPFTLSVGWLKDLSSAAVHLYSKGVKHKDIKAENLLVYAYPARLVAKLCDFGLARQSSASMSSSSGGTANFEAPEVRSQGKASFASDVFSIGMTAVQILTRQAPGRHEWQEQVNAAMDKHPKSPAQESVHKLLLRMIDAEQFKRPNAVECAAALEAALSALGGDPRTDRHAPEYDLVKAIEDRVKAAREAKQSDPPPSPPARNSSVFSLGSNAASPRPPQSTPTSPAGGRASSKGSAYSWSKLEPLGLLGQGSFSAVVRARDAVKDKDVAVKVFKLRGDLHHRTDLRDIEYKVAREVQSFDPTHTTCIYGVVDGELGDEWVAFLRQHLQSVSARGFSLHPGALAEGIVSRLEEGGTLSELLHSPGRPCDYWTLPLDERLRLLKEVAEGLMLVHEQNITHGDLKPDNILLSGKREIRLTDYGLSKLLSEKEIRQASTLAFGSHGGGGGTEDYKAPEMGIDNVLNSRTTDMYSFGTIAWEVLSGKRPSDLYSGMGSFQRLEAIKSGKQLLDPAAMKENVPIAVREMIQQCLTYAPAVGGLSQKQQQRPSANDALQVLKTALQQQLGKKRDIFLSYCWGPPKTQAPSLFGLLQPPAEKVYPRQAFALEIYKELRALGFNVWMDVYDMGVDLKDSMKKGIEKSSCVVVLLSPEYAKSRNCRFEVDYAVQQKKPIITCMVCDPDKDIWPRMAEPEFADVCGTGKLNIAGHMFCNMGPAAALDWTQPISGPQREMLTHATEALRKLRGSLERAGVVASGGGSSASTGSSGSSGADSSGALPEPQRMAHVFALRESFHDN